MIPSRNHKESTGMVRYCVVVPRATGQPAMSKDEKEGTLYHFANKAVPRVVIAAGL
jgi:hypothetical protein